MYILLAILLAAIWGLFVGHYFPEPLSMVLAIIGGGCFGIFGGLLQISQRRY